MRRLFGGLGYTPAVQPAGAEWAWVGNVTTTSATVKVRSQYTPTLLYGTDSDLVDPDNVAGSEGSDEVWTFNLSSLTANSRYYYAVAGAALATGTFRTFPSGQASFTIAAASCAGSTPGNSQADYNGPGQTSNSPAFARILDRDPLLMIHMGDRGYPDITTNDAALYWTNYNNNMANANQLAMHLAMPVAYHWSDHDYGDNDSVGTHSSKAAAQAAYRTHVPHWTLPSASAIYQKFTIGRTEWFLLDVHSERSANNATDNSSKTMLGATQKQWLKDELSASTAKVLVIGINTNWIAGEAAAPTWAQFTTERAELADYIIAEGLDSNVLLVNGDHHFICGDDGTNGEGGLPSVGFAPLDSTFSNDTGTHSEGIIKTSKQQYGTITFTDAGATITARMQGWAVTDETEVQVMDFSIVFDAT